jgi:hypothetical protein
MIIINLTQHPASAEQMAEGVIDPQNRGEVIALITFNSFEETEPQKMHERAEKLTRIAKNSGADAAMIGGALYFQSTLENALLAEGIQPCYAFSLRVTEEEILPNGDIKKTQIFKHGGLRFPRV